MSHIPSLPLSLPAWTVQQPQPAPDDLGFELYRNYLKEHIEKVALKIDGLRGIVLGGPFFEEKEQLYVRVMLLTLNDLRCLLLPRLVEAPQALSFPALTEGLSYSRALDLAAEVKQILNCYNPFELCRQGDLNLTVPVGVLVDCCDQLSSTISNKLALRLQNLFNPLPPPAIPQSVDAPALPPAPQGAKRKGDFSVEASKVPRMSLLKRYTSRKDLVPIFEIAYPVKSQLVFTGASLGRRCEVVSYDHNPEETDPIEIAIVSGQMEHEVDTNYKKLFYVPVKNEEVLIDFSLRGTSVYTKIKVTEVVFAKTLKEIEVKGLDSFSRERSYSVDSLIDLFPFKPLQEAGLCVVCEEAPEEGKRFYIRLTVPEKHQSQVHSYYNP